MNIFIDFEVEGTDGNFTVISESAPIDPTAWEKLVSKTGHECFDVIRIYGNALPSFSLKDIADELLKDA